MAAGPVGRTASANTDPMFKSQVLSYSRSEGVFAGVSLEGTVLAVDDGADETAYGVTGILASQILAGQTGTPPAAALAFKAALEHATSQAASAEEPAAAPVATPAATAPAAGAAAPAATDASSAPVQTYPMEDPAPGAPPPD